MSPTPAEHAFFIPLRELRDEALEKSHLSGKCRRLGEFTLHGSDALWKNAEGGEAYLTDRGLRRNGLNITNPFPTILRLSNVYVDTEKRTAVTTFYMNLDYDYRLEVFHTIYERSVFGSLRKNWHDRGNDRQHNLLAATDDEKTLLRSEMERGASGLHIPERDNG